VISWSLVVEDLRGKTMMARSANISFGDVSRGGESGPEKSTEQEGGDDEDNQKLLGKGLRAGDNRHEKKV
jgi:hypothetical protein